MREWIFRPVSGKVDMRRGWKKEGFIIIITKVGPVGA